MCLSALGAHAHFRVCEWLDPWSSSGSAHSSHPRKVAPPIRRRSDAWRAVSAFTHLCWHGGRHSGVHQWNSFWCQVGTSCSQPLNKSLTQCQFISYCWCTMLFFSIWLMIIVRPSGAFCAWKDCFIWNVVTAECSANHTHSKWHIIIINTKNQWNFSSNCILCN